MRLDRRCGMEGWHLSAVQRRVLERELMRTQDAALVRRLSALLQVDAGDSVTEVAHALRVHRRSVHRWMNHWRNRGHPDALADHRGQGRPALWRETWSEFLEFALTQAPWAFHYPANTWTVPLLHDLLGSCCAAPPVSPRTLRRHLKALGYGWKRFRYVLEPDPEAEKKTADFAANSGLARRNRFAGRGRNRSAPLPTVARRLGAPGAGRTGAAGGL